MLLKAKRGNKKAQPILYGWNGGRHYFMDHRFEADVWEIARRGSLTMLHPTQKPLGLIQRALRNSSRPKENVLDPFAGSGSTIVAAEREGRIVYAMDMDPIYIDVSIRRYAALGGPTEKEIRATKRKIKVEEPA
ncbi:DNA adenine methyltransferase YhdJ [subsurface metagenome]